MKNGFSPWLRISLSGMFVLASFGSSASGVSNLEMRAQLGSQKGTILSAEMPGRIKRIPLQDGERFRRGQLLLEFDCDLQEAQLAKANAQLRATENTLQGQQRLAELNAIGMVELFNSEAEVLKARADVSYLQVIMRRCRITAPFDGRVIQYGVREHQSVQTSHELVEVMDDGALELVFLVPSQWLSWLEPGYRFEVKIDDTGNVYPARVLRTAAKVDAISQTVRTVAELDGRFPELLPGMSGTVQLRPNPM